MADAVTTPTTQQGISSPPAVPNSLAEASGRRAQSLTDHHEHGAVAPVDTGQLKHSIFIAQGNAFEASMASSADGSTFEVADYLKTSDDFRSVLAMCRTPEGGKAAMQQIAI